jgi:hypothetical protein
MMTMKSALSFIALAALASACGASFRQATPDGFVELEDQRRYDYRAVTADGLVLGVREIEHKPAGQIDFWVGAIGNHMRERGGYALLEVVEVKNAQGLSGKQLRFGHDEGSRPHLYHVTLFVTDEKIYLLEAGGSAELVKRHAAQLDQAVQAFQVK